MLDVGLLDPFFELRTLSEFHRGGHGRSRLLARSGFYRCDHGRSRHLVLLGFHRCDHGRSRHLVLLGFHRYCQFLNELAQEGESDAVIG